MMRTLLLGLCLLPQLALAELSFAQLGQLTDNPESLSGEFQQSRYLAYLDTSLKSSGRFEYLQGKSIRWITTQPIANELLLTPTSITTLQDGQQLSRLSADNNPVVAMLSQIFFAVLTADWQPLAELFELSGEVTETGWQGQLKPKTDAVAAFVDHIELKGDSLMRELVIHESGSNYTRIHFYPQQENDPH